ncbi:MAG: 2-oxo acid dehydrogenase subunit E2 [Thermotogae bacterium]|nr:2-oxo acid dehydrogenase subunit E2 [Thermotogota bacterium]
MFLLKMPKFGLNMESGFINKWYKKEGDKVKKGEVLVEIASEKITNDLESPVDGYVKKLMGKEGEEYKVGEMIAYIAETEEELAKEGNIPPKEVEKASASPEKSVEEKEKVERVAIPVETGFVRASPAAKRLAREKGVDIKEVRGTGPGGRIVEKDVMNFVKGRRQTVEEEFTVEKLSPLRKMISRNLARSYHEAVVITNATRIDLTEFFRIKKDWEVRQKVSVTAMLLKVVSRVLSEYSSFNAHFDGENIKKFKKINIGVAVDTERGLIVPVIKRVDELSIREISAALARVSSFARKGNIQEADLIDSGFTITNLGMMRTEIFTPALNGNEVAILGVGKTRKELKIGDEVNIMIRDMAWFSLSYDHRVIDGALAAKFLGRLAELLEKPDWIKDEF